MQLHFLKANLFYNRLLQLSMLGIVILIYRIFITKSSDFTFLLWNLFLATIPLLISKQITTHNWQEKSKYIRFATLLFWILFLPNSPYIITDLMHLDTSKPTLWVDLLMLFVFALNGVLLGTLSMMDVFSYLQKRNHPILANGILLGVSLLSGYGIFLGRFLRFNSWDIFFRPQFLLECIFKSLLLPEARLWMFGFGSFIWISFWVLKPFLRGIRNL
ncbi:DUF1361 domain-containing protein [Maribacter sp. CXY002]|uniref:DUF1361 domain-containing protein n=1 Tax=Maribacter luteocoastalis TaxID=3407671 RepID=UPI003B680765